MKTKCFLYGRFGNVSKQEMVTKKVFVNFVKGMIGGKLSLTKFRIYAKKTWIEYSFRPSAKFHSPVWNTNGLDALIFRIEILLLRLSLNEPDIEHRIHIPATHVIKLMERNITIGTWGSKSGSRKSMYYDFWKCSFIKLSWIWFLLF